jgi:hypothetical protein
MGCFLYVLSCLKWERKVVLLFLRDILLRENATSRGGSKNFFEGVGTFLSKILIE